MAIIYCSGKQFVVVHGPTSEYREVRPDLDSALALAVNTKEAVTFASGAAEKLHEVMVERMKHEHLRNWGKS